MIKHPNILLIPYSEQLGTTYPIILFGKLLQNKGYNVWVGGSGKFMFLAEQWGLQTVKLPEIPFKRYRQAVDKLKLNFQTRDEILFHIQKEQKVLKDLHIDLIIASIRHTIRITAKLLNIPVVALNHLQLTNYYSGPEELPEALQNKLTKILGIDPLFLKLSHILLPKKAAQVYNSVAQQILGYKFTNIYDYFGGDYNLLWDIQEMFPNAQALPFNYFFIGHILNNIFEKQGLNFIKKIKEKKRKGQKIIFLTLGSSGWFIKELTKYIIEYVEKHSNVTLVMSQSIYKIPNLKKNNRIVTDKFLNNFLITPLVDVVITHGGKGSSWDTLYNKKPLIMFPHQVEQQWNALLLEQYNIGKKLSIKNFSKTDLFNALDLYLFDDFDNSTINYFGTLLQQKYNWKKTLLELIEYIC